MSIYLIVAMDSNGLIGKRLQDRYSLPWPKMPADLKHFKDMTTGHVVIMGRHTFDSLPHVLPNRINIVITRDRSFYHEGILVVNSLASALSLAASYDSEIFIIGGAEIYLAAKDIVDRIYSTLICTKSAGNIIFPFSLADWSVISKEAFEPDRQNPFAFEFQVLERT